MLLLNTHNFILVNADTDSISFCKPNGEAFTEEESISLVNEINSLLPEKIKYERDGSFTKMIVAKAKNYITYNGKTIKYKGSSIKSSTLEPALKEFIHEVVEGIVNEKNNHLEIYLKYVKEVLDITDIKRWATKKSLTNKVYTSTRKNETKILDAIQDTEYVEGDKVFLFYRKDKSLALIDKFDAACYHVDTYLEKLFKVTKRFEGVLDTSVFKNYKLKKNKTELETL